MSLNLDDANEEMYYKKYLKYKEKYIKLVLEKHGGTLTIPTDLFTLDYIYVKHYDTITDNVKEAIQLYECLYNIDMCTKKLHDINNWLKSLSSVMLIHAKLIVASGNCEKWLQKAKSQLVAIRSNSKDQEIKTINSLTDASKKISSLIQDIQPFNENIRDLMKEFLS